MCLFLRHWACYTVGRVLEECYLLETFVEFLMCDKHCVRHHGGRERNVKLFLSWRSCDLPAYSAFSAVDHTSVGRLRLCYLPWPLCHRNSINVLLFFSLKTNCQFLPPLLLIIQASLLKGKHLFTGSVSTDAIYWYYILIFIVKFARSIICSYMPNFVRSWTFKNH